jgi:hypothetical protein
MLVLGQAHAGPPDAAIDAWAMRDRIGRGINAKCFKVNGLLSWVRDYRSQYADAISDAGFNSVRLWGHGSGCGVSTEERPGGYAPVPRSVFLFPRPLTNVRGDRRTAVRAQSTVTGEASTGS